MVHGVGKEVLDVESAMVKYHLYKVVLSPGFIANNSYSGYLHRIPTGDDYVAPPPPPAGSEKVSSRHINMIMDAERYGALLTGRSPLPNQPACIVDGIQLACLLVFVWQLALYTVGDQLHR